MKISIKNNQLTAVIDSIGAELVSLKKSSTNREYIWEGNPVFWGKHSPVLFPIVGTLKNNQYQYKNKRLNSILIKSLKSNNEKGSKIRLKSNGQQVAARKIPRSF